MASISLVPAGFDALAPMPHSPASTHTGSSALVYCEGNFGELDGKTANGLVRSSERYDIVGVIDSRLAGADAGRVLDDAPNGIPVYQTLARALAEIGAVPEYFIFGVAPASGRLTDHERKVVFEAIAAGMNVVSGLHEFLADDPEFVAAAAAHSVTLLDVRRPRPKGQLRVFSGEIFDVTCPRIAVLGTDGAIGKRTTATLLTEALNRSGVRSVMVGTGQTSLIQGARYGAALDAIAPQFCSGEMERAVVEAAAENPELIVIEGQGALSHPAYLTSAYILRGSRPAAVVLQHAPRRRSLCDFPTLPMPSPESEIELIERFGDTSVIGVTMNHEGMATDEIETELDRLATRTGLPTCDPLTSPPERLVEMVTAGFPALAPR